MIAAFVTRMRITTTRSVRRTATASTGVGLLLIIVVSAAAMILLVARTVTGCGRERLLPMNVVLALVALPELRLV